MQSKDLSNNQWRKHKRRTSAEKLAELGLGGRKSATLDKLRYATHEMRIVILERDKYQCRYCSSPVTLESANIDHVIPWKLGGRTHSSNLVVACTTCNRNKGNGVGVRPTVKGNRTKGVKPMSKGKIAYIQRAKEIAQVVNIPCDHRSSPNCKRIICVRERLKALV